MSQSGRRINQMQSRLQSRLNTLYKELHQKFSKRLREISDEDLEQLSEFQLFMTAKKLANADGKQWDCLPVEKQAEYCQQAENPEMIQKIRQLSDSQLAELIKDNQRLVNFTATFSDLQGIKEIHKFLDGLENNKNESQKRVG